VFITLFLSSGYFPQNQIAWAFSISGLSAFSQALAAMRHKSFVLKSVAEAKQSNLHIAEDAALSRLRPIPDGPDQWMVHRSSADSGSCGPTAPLDSDNVPI
jgi:hypothetical protein